MFVERGAASAVRVHGAPQAPVASGACTVVVRNAAPACLARRKNRGISTGSSKARSLQSIQYAGPACAMPGKTIDGEKIDEAIR
ncbi:TPA: hypothetical protein ACT5B7_003757 [Burkholderia cenocepacia]